MIDELLRYRQAMQKASEEIELAGYTVNVKSGGKNVLRIGKVKNKSYFGMLGSVEIMDTAKALELANRLRKC